MVNRQFEIGNDGFAIERFAQGMQFNKGSQRMSQSFIVLLYPVG